MSHLEASGWSMSDLSTVRRPSRDMAASAAKLLLARIDGAVGRHTGTPSSSLSGAGA